MTHNYINVEFACILKQNGSGSWKTRVKFSKYKIIVEYYIKRVFDVNKFPI